MKLTKFLTAALTIVFTFSWFGAAALNTAAQSNNDYVALYRLYNAQNRDRIYTTSCDERNTIVRNGFADEGVAGYVASRQLRRTTPLYRLLLSSGVHFYTTDNQEMTNLSQTAGNKSEGIAGYVANSQMNRTVPFYRLLGSDRHLYTTNEQEKNNFLQTAGNRSEGVAGYLWSSGRNQCDSFGGGGSPIPGSFPVIYAQANFQGPSTAVERDFAGSRDWEGDPHVIRSIRVPQGWYLVLYDKRNYKGKSYNLNSDWTPQPGDGWYGRIKSIKVYQGTPPRQPR